MISRSDQWSSRRRRRRLKLRSPSFARVPLRRREPGTWLSSGPRKLMALPTAFARSLKLSAHLQPQCRFACKRRRQRLRPSSYFPPTRWRSSEVAPPLLRPGVALEFALRGLSLKSACSLNLSEGLLILGLWLRLTLSPGSFAVVVALMPRQLQRKNFSRLKMLAELPLAYASLSGTLLVRSGLGLGGLRQRRWRRLAVLRYIFFLLSFVYCVVISFVFQDFAFAGACQEKGEG